MSFVDTIEIVNGDTIHGFAHYWVSGVWEPGNGLSTSTLQEVEDGPTDFWVWPFDVRLRQDGCIVCPCESAPCDTCQYGCELGVSGTFQRSSVANQDPVFYLHHAFTFVVVERAMRRQGEYAAKGEGGNHQSPPFYGLDEDFNYGERERECPGNNLDEGSPFNHLGA
uniref:Uncharacterized protein n=1 Tax=Emiliania huxleyi (strain CCMP1516) TaxID=280463 RepID=A0A0D3IAI5_EMIH1